MLLMLLRLILTPALVLCYLSSTVMAGAENKTIHEVHISPPPPAPIAGVHIKRFSSEFVFDKVRIAEVLADPKLISASDDNIVQAVALNYEKFLDAGIPVLLNNVEIHKKPHNQSADAPWPTETVSIGGFRIKIWLPTLHGEALDKQVLFIGAKFTLGLQGNSRATYEIALGQLSGLSSVFELPEAKLENMGSAVLAWTTSPEENEGVFTTLAALEVKHEEISATATEQAKSQTDGVIHGKIRFSPATHRWEVSNLKFVKQATDCNNKNLYVMPELEQALAIAHSPVNYLRRSRANTEILPLSIWPFRSSSTQTLQSFHGLQFFSLTGDSEHVLISGFSGKKALATLVIRMSILEQVMDDMDAAKDFSTFGNYGLTPLVAARLTTLPKNLDEESLVLRWSTPFIDLRDAGADAFPIEVQNVSHGHRLLLAQGFGITDNGRQPFTLAPYISLPALKSTVPGIYQPQDFHYWMDFSDLISKHDLVDQPRLAMNTVVLSWILGSGSLRVTNDNSSTNSQVTGGDFSAYPLIIGIPSVSTDFQNHQLSELTLLSLFAAIDHVRNETSLHRGHTAYLKVNTARFGLREWKESVLRTVWQILSENARTEGQVSVIEFEDLSTNNRANSEVAAEYGAFVANIIYMIESYASPQIKVALVGPQWVFPKVKETESRNLTSEQIEVKKKKVRRSYSLDEFLDENYYQWFLRSLFARDSIAISEHVSRHGVRALKKSMGRIPLTSLEANAKIQIRQLNTSSSTAVSEEQFIALLREASSYVGRFWGQRPAPMFSSADLQKVKAALGAPSRAGFVGLDADWARMLLGIEAFMTADHQQQSFHAITLLGPPGVGKSELAKLLIKELGARSITLDATSLDSNDFWSQIDQLARGPDGIKIVDIEEIDKAPAFMISSFLQALNNYNSDLAVSSHSSRFTPDFTGVIVVFTGNVNTNTKDGQQWAATLENRTSAADEKRSALRSLFLEAMSQSTDQNGNKVALDNTADSLSSRLLQNTIYMGNGIVENADLLEEFLANQITATEALHNVRMILSPAAHTSLVAGIKQRRSGGLREMSKFVQEQLGAAMTDWIQFQGSKQAHNPTALGRPILFLSPIQILEGSQALQVKSLELTEQQGEETLLVQDAMNRVIDSLTRELNSLVQVSRPAGMAGQLAFNANAPRLTQTMGLLRRAGAVPVSQWTTLPLLENDSATQSAHMPMSPLFTDTQRNLELRRILGEDPASLFRAVLRADSRADHKKILAGFLEFTSTFQTLGQYVTNDQTRGDSGSWNPGRWKLWMERLQLSMLQNFPNSQGAAMWTQAEHNSGLLGPWGITGIGYYLTLAREVLAAEAKNLVAELKQSRAQYLQQEQEFATSGASPLCAALLEAQSAANSLFGPVTGSPREAPLGLPTELRIR